MKPSIIAVLFIALTSFTTLQGDRYANSYISKNGKIHFFSATPVENIEATSGNALCVFNTETMKLNAKVKMESFRFEKKLMEEHFNENYMETEKYPDGVLDAVITDKVDFTKEGNHNVNLHGTFEIHGVKQERDIKGVLTVKNGMPAMATAKFDVKLADHKIKIPKAVVMNIAEVITIDVEFRFEKYQKN